jgi:enoyl-CoA hydratase
MKVLVEKNGNVTTVIINRSDVRNAIDYPTATALADAFREFERDENAGAAVLCGAGGNFCAGADLKAVASGGENMNKVTEDGDGPLGPTRLKLSKPVIAAVSGYAVAGGFELALWCDLRVCEESSVFGFFDRRWGVPLIDGGTIRLPRLIGLSRALDMILTGRPVKADEAYVMGLANRVVKDGTARQEAEKLAAQIVAFPQTCMRNDRLSTIEQFDYSFDDALKNELQHGMHALNSPEITEGVTRFAKGSGRHGKF